MPPGPVSVRTVSPLMFVTSILVVSRAVPDVRRYTSSAPYGGLGARKYLLAVKFWVLACEYSYAVFGVKKLVARAITPLFISSSGAMSTIQIDRPWVAAISSRSRG